MTKPSSLFANKFMLAPMVRVGTLPMRLMALKYGADIVYSPEIIDRRLIETTRVENKIVGTIDFVDNGKTTTCLRVSCQEKEKLIVQLGSSNPKTALEAARRVEQDCMAIDLNCGCPKKFSIAGGMGAALLETPDNLISILETLVQNLSIPVTCKIRILPNVEKTLTLIQRIAQTGVQAIAIHCRTKHNRPQDPAQWSFFNQLQDLNLDIPVIANGDIFLPQDVQTLNQDYPSIISSFMLARGAQTNVTVFQFLKDQSKKPLNVYKVMQEYVLTAAEYDMPFQNAKYALCQMVPPKSNSSHKQLEKDFGFKYPMNELIKCKSILSLCELLNVKNEFEGILKKNQDKSLKENLFPKRFGQSNPENDVEFPYVPDAPFIPETKRIRLE